MNDAHSTGADPASVALADAVDGLPAGPDGYSRIEANEALWIGLAKGCAAGLQDLSALWFDNGAMHMALSDAQKKRAIVSFALRDGGYPSVGARHAPAMRLERAMRDLYGVNPMGLPDERSWLDHGAWPSRPARTESGYSFLQVDGAGLHQIPVGPVHAGIIEPGHFRFTANGETVVRLEERLGYVHKGVEALCAGAPLAQAGKIVARISGDSTVAYSFAFAMAVEKALGWEIPERAHVLRGVMAELERLANHVGDVGAICNDASVIAVQARCALIREEILRASQQCFCHRLMMDRIVPGGVACNLDGVSAAVLQSLLDHIEASFARVISVYDQSPSLQNRTVNTGFAQPDYIRQFAAGGYVGRAAGRDFDARVAFPYPPYDSVTFEVPTRTKSDVDLRVWIRIDEIAQSISIIRQLIGKLQPGPVLAASRIRARSGRGFGGSVSR